MEQRDPSADERELVRRAQGRDREALGALYEQYFERVHRYARARLRDVAEAEDVTEEVFVKMLDNISSFQWREVSFASWLLRIAHNVIIDRSRRQAYQRQRLPVLAFSANELGNVDAEVDRRLDKEELLRAIAELSPAQRDVITLRFGGELSVAETAAALGKREGNVKVLQHNALLALRRLLAGRLAPKEA